MNACLPVGREHRNQFGVNLQRKYNSSTTAGSLIYIFKHAQIYTGKFIASFVSSIFCKLFYLQHCHHPAYQ